jgi:hypothetical protein
MMKVRFLGLSMAMTGLLVVSGSSQVARASGLQVTYSNNGVEQLSYNGLTLEDVSRDSSDAFHIYHMSATSVNGGGTLTSGQYGWGENYNSKNWNSSTHTFTYTYIWGSISVQLQQSGNNLNMNVVTKNNANSGIIFNGANIYPFVLHFPRLPTGFVDSSYQHFAFNTTGPSVTIADYGQGEVAAVVTDPSRPLYSGFQPTGGTLAYYPIIGTTAIEGMASFFPHNNRTVAPGQTDSFTVSLRFAPSGTPATTIAADAYANWASKYTQQLHWSDRRIIGTAYLASSPQGNPNVPAGFPNNPRRYYNDSNANDFDVRTSSGLAKFQARILSQAQKNVQNMQKLNAQGTITWDLEGEQYPQMTSYVCEPDQIAQIAPEMDSVIHISGSPYNGMKLDDAYFKIMRAAGFRVGVCVRPQHFTQYSNGTAAQVYLPSSQVASELIRKVKYAHDRWGATLFYIDSSVDSNGGALDPSIIQQVAAAVPDSLLIPEESTTRDYAYSAPFQTFIFHRDLGTPTTVQSLYPGAFSANLINDVNAATLNYYRPELTDSVRRGDILMVHSDYWQANDPTVVQIYHDAGK